MQSAGLSANGRDLMQSGALREATTWAAVLLMGDQEQARAHFAAALRIDPDHNHAQRGMGNLLTEIGDFAGERRSEIQFGMGVNAGTRRADRNYSSGCRRGTMRLPIKICTASSF